MQKKNAKFVLPCRCQPANNDAMNVEVADGRRLTISWNAGEASQQSENELQVSREGKEQAFQRLCLVVRDVGT